MPHAPLRFRRGQHVYVQGERALRLYRAETGLLRVVKVTPRGRVLTVRHVLPGDFFGEDALHGGTYQHQVEVLTRALVRILDPLTLGGPILQEVVRSLGEQLRRAMQHEYNLQTGDLKQRVVRYLLELADTPLGGEDRGNHLFVRATHELLAEGTASTRESVSKIMTELREAGLIESGYRHITLLNLEELSGLLSKLHLPGAKPGRQS
nr:helix-turn-helix domain-containing protein [Deinobacterium chartae]